MLAGEECAQRCPITGGLRVEHLNPSGSKNSRFVPDAYALSAHFHSFFFAESCVARIRCCPAWRAVLDESLRRHACSGALVLSGVLVIRNANPNPWLGGGMFSSEFFILQDRILPTLIGYQFAFLLCHTVFIFLMQA